MNRADVHLGNPIVRGGLTVFPVFNGAAVTRAGYQLHGAALTVNELDDGPSVGRLAVRNASDEPALVLEGELLEGGRQHRVAVRSTMVEARSSDVLAVRCVEQGRWSGSGAHQRQGRRAPMAVRAAADDQGAVWRRVSHYGSSATGSLLEATRDVEAIAARLVDGLLPLAFQSGALFGVAGQPLALEVFDSPDTLAAVWDQLLLAAAVDAVFAAPVATVPTPGRRARRFAQRIKAAPEGRSDYARLSTLEWRGRAVHTTAVNVRHELVAA